MSPLARLAAPTHDRSNRATALPEEHNMTTTMPGRGLAQTVAKRAIS
jgi:hypothetical protein